VNVKEDDGDGFAIVWPYVTALPLFSILCLSILAKAFTEVM